MRTIDRYLLCQVIKNAGVVLICILVAVLLDRMVRILAALGPTEDLPIYLFNLLLNRIPDVVGVGLPAAFFGGVLLAFGLLNREGELDALYSLGVGLHRLILPVFGLAIVVSLIAFAVLGFLRPYGMYQFGLLVHQAKQTSYMKIFKIGTIIHIENSTLYVKDWSRGADDFGELFVFERDQSGDMNVTTAKRGYLTSSDDELDLLLVARDGQQTTIAKDGGVSTLLSFDNARWRLYSINETAFRPRGRPESEKTLIELWNLKEEDLSHRKWIKISAELHQRLAHIVSILLMPFVAVPLALGRTFIGQAVGFAAGVVVIIGIDQGILMGEVFAARDLLSPWIGIWGTVGCVALIGLILFPLAALRVAGDPLSLSVAAISNVIVSSPKGKDRMSGAS